jgi:hypothetical protein
MELLYKESEVVERMASLPKVLTEFLEAQKFAEALEEIRGNSASYPAFQKRFWRWFTMFRIMKFLHFARDRGYPDIQVDEAAKKMLGKLSPNNFKVSGSSVSKELLLIYRSLERPN